MSAVRELKTLHKCFIPNCPNSVAKTKDKLLIHVSKAVKRKWCEQVKIVYNPDKIMYCCEDHLDMNEDLENYYQWKFMKARPRLKSTATLRYSLPNVTSQVIKSTENEKSGVQMETGDESSSELRKILLQPTEKSCSRKPTSSKSTVVVQAMALIHCLSCSSEIVEDAQHYLTSDLSPEIISLLEKNLRSKIAHDGVVCSKCFTNILQNLEGQAKKLTTTRHIQKQHKPDRPETTGLLFDPGSDVRGKVVAIEGNEAPKATENETAATVVSEESNELDETIQKQSPPVPKLIPTASGEKESKANKSKTDAIIVAEESCEPDQKQIPPLHKDTTFEIDDISGYLHEALCYECTKEIRGFRYVCVQCIDVSLCASCEARRAHEYHYMLRIPPDRPQKEVERMVQVVRDDVCLFLLSNPPLEDEPEVKTEVVEDFAPDPLKVEPNFYPHGENMLEQAMLDIDLIDVVKHDITDLEVKISTTLTDNKTIDATPKVPVNTEATPTVPEFSRVTPRVPVYTEATPTDPVPSRVTPKVRVYTEATRRVPVYIEATPGVPVYTEATPTVPESSRVTPRDSLSTRITPTAYVCKTITPIDNMSIEAAPEVYVSRKVTPTVPVCTEVASINEPIMTGTPGLQKYQLTAPMKKRKTTLLSNSEKIFVYSHKGRHYTGVIKHETPENTGSST